MITNETDNDNDIVIESENVMDIENVIDKDLSYTLPQRRAFHAPTRFFVPQDHPDVELPTELDELKADPSWVVCRMIKEKGKAKPRKKPINPVSRRGASTTDPRTWVEYATARDAYGRCKSYVAMGYVFHNAGIVAIDFDHCVEEVRPGVYEVVNPEIDSIIKRMNSYTELSISKTGVHILVKGVMPELFNKNPKLHDGGDFEVYVNARYFVLTGYTAVSCNTIMENQSAINLMLSVYDFKPKETKPCTMPTGGFYLSDSADRILEKARTKGNYQKFIRLYDNGDISEYPSQNHADMALCRMLLYWCDGDTVMANELFMASALMRDKWIEDRKGKELYSTKTIRKAYISHISQYQYYNHNIS